MSANWAHLYWIPLFRVGGEQEVVVCRDCRSVMPPELAEGGSSTAPSAPSGWQREEPAVWTCARCGNVNPRDAVTCLRCGGGA